MKTYDLLKGLMRLRGIDKVTLDWRQLSKEFSFTFQSSYGTIYAEGRTKLAAVLDGITMLGHAETVPEGVPAEEIIIFKLDKELSSQLPKDPLKRDRAVCDAIRTYSP